MGNSSSKPKTMSAQAKGMKYYEYTKEYYTKQITLNSWIQNTIDKDIIAEIAAFSVGIFLPCNNSTCNHDVSIFNKDANSYEPMRPMPGKVPCTGRYAMSADKYYESYGHALPTTKIDDKYKDEVYFYNDQANSGDFAYCIDCTKTMADCNGGDDLNPCSGVIFEAAPNSMIVCGTPNHSAKRLCWMHTSNQCNKCGTGMCGDLCQNSVNHGDFCSPRKCSTCGINGCQRCVPMVSCSAVLQRFPPSYQNPVYKCQNNPDCQ